MSIPKVHDSTSSSAIFLFFWPSSSPSSIASVPVIAQNSFASSAHSQFNVQSTSSSSSSPSIHVITSTPRLSPCSSSPAHL
ncbi:hypothetical protein U1Q18_039526, partial [Sarracenia purpurea var. burkii]